MGVFNATQTTDWVVAYDPSRLVDTNSGGPANDLKIADVFDIHDYPGPQDPQPSATQYAMIGKQSTADHQPLSQDVQMFNYSIGSCTMP